MICIKDADQDQDRDIVFEDMQWHHYQQWLALIQQNKILYLETPQGKVALHQPTIEASLEPVAEASNRSQTRDYDSPLYRIQRGQKDTKFYYHLPTRSLHFIEQPKKISVVSTSDTAILHAMKCAQQKWGKFVVNCKDSKIRQRYYDLALANQMGHSISQPEFMQYKLKKQQKKKPKPSGSSPGM